MNESRWNVYYFKHKDKFSIFESLDEIDTNFRFSFNDNDKFMVANTFTKCAIELDEVHYKALKNKKYDIISEDITILKDQGVLIDDDIDEIEYLRKLRRQYSFDKNFANLTICPTMDCNFNCPYCYEIKKPGYMSQNIQYQLLLFYEKLLKSGIKEVKVTWYGGEPLLYPNVIENISKKMISLSKQYVSKISFSMISNGYCISDDILRIFKDINLKTIQITIDGSPDIHNSRRALIDGRPTFKVIVKNINKLAKANITVKVRVNLDKNNSNEFNSVKKLFFDNKNIFVYPALVTKEEKQSNQVKENCFDTLEYSNVLINDCIISPKTYEQLGACTIVCSGEHFNSYAVTPDGNLYKCLNDIGIVSKCIGTLSNYNNATNTSYANKYINRDPFTEDKCKKCSYIPLCYGACLNEFLKNGVHNCVYNRYYFDEISKYLMNKD